MSSLVVIVKKTTKLITTAGRMSDIKCLHKKCYSMIIESHIRSFKAELELLPSSPWAR